jgi:hypothetical protein
MTNPPDVGARPLDTDLILDRVVKLRSDLLRLQRALEQPAAWNAPRLPEYRARNHFDSARHYWAAIAREFES